MAAVPPWRRYRIGVVGAGRVGSVLGAALRDAGHELVAVSGGSSASRVRIETLLPGLAAQSSEQVAAAAGLVLLSVPDDALAALVARLDAAGAWRPDHVVVHTSGMHGTDVLAAAEERGAVGVALHPVLTFTGTHVDLGRLPGCAFGLTAEARGRAIGTQLAGDLGGTPVVVPADRRALYHAGLAHGANHLVGLVAQAADMLRAAGSADPARLLRPLLTAALDNALTDGDAALTGPVVRGDIRTVTAHLRALDAAGDELPDATGVRAAYAAMARVSATRAVRSGRLSDGDGAAIVALTARPAPQGRVPGGAA